jgi:hypothetical protein
MRAHAALIALWTTGCWVDEARLLDAQDRDGDGFLPVDVGGDDCDDDDPAIHPEANELCGDGRDNDCDGRTDDTGVGERIFHADADGDGFGREVTAIAACEAPPGHVTAIGDCDDEDPTIHPEADDLCNARDDDCDGRIDEDVPPVVRFRDADGDQRGDFAVQVTTCDPDLPGHVAVDGDCDDSDPAVYSGAPDADCDGVDNDCDGTSDEHAVFTTWRPDLDGDGWGDPDGIPVSSCADVAGHAPTTGDCDDANPLVAPDRQDGDCDGVDDDCNGIADDQAVFVDYIPDTDGDGWGDAAFPPVASCAPIPGSVTRGGDCDDNAPAIHQGANDDNCDGIDNDCDGVADDDAVFALYFVDDDDDGWGADTGALESCLPLPDRVLRAGDCADDDATRHPAVPEACDGIDNDCNGQIDDGLPITLYFDDDDGDGFGAPGTGIATCDTGDGRVLDATDCADDDPFVNPAATDTCDGVDTDCNGSIDDDATFTLYYPDADGDGLGATGAPFSSCFPEPGAVLVPGDCDDADPQVTGRRWYTDADGDGFGTLPLFAVCDPPADTTATFGDCEDADPLVFPGVPEVCGDGVDNGCDGVDDCVWRDTILASSADRVVDIGSAFGLVDFDGDGQPDIWRTGPGGVIEVFAGPEVPSGRATWVLPSGCSVESIPDINRDGRPDAVCSRPGAVTLYVDGEPQADFTSTVPAFGSRIAAQRSVDALWIGDDSTMYRFATLMGSLTTADGVPVSLSGAFVSLTNEGEDGFLVVEEHRVRVFDDETDLNQGLPSFQQLAAPGETFMLQTQVHTDQLTRSYLATVSLVDTVPSTRTWAFEGAPVASSLDDRASSILVGPPNAPAYGLAVPGVYFDIDEPNIETVAWVFTGASATLPRTSVIVRADGELGAADADAWFVDGISRPLDFLGAFDDNGDGARDLFFRDVDDRLLIFHRTLE